MLETIEVVHRYISTKCIPKSVWLPTMFDATTSTLFSSSLYNI